MKKTALQFVVQILVTAIFMGWVLKHFYTSHPIATTVVAALWIIAVTLAARAVIRNFTEVYKGPVMDHNLFYPTVPKPPKKKGNQRCRNGQPHTWGRSNPHASVRCTKCNARRSKVVR